MRIVEVEGNGTEQPARDGEAARIMIADDHPLVAQGLARILRDSPEFEVSGVFSALGELHESLAEDPPDALVVDIDMPGMTIFTFLRRVRRHFPDLPVLVVSGLSEEVYAVRVVKAGARGFVPKEAAVPELVSALRAVVAGQLWVNGALSANFRRFLPEKGAAHGIEALSPRELEVFQLLGKGLTAREVGEVLHISHRTVASHRLRIYHKLGIGSVNELIRLSTEFLNSQEGS